MTEDDLRRQLHNIEASFARREGKEEENDKQAACQRIQEKLEELQETSRTVEMVFHFQESWCRKLFVALCRRYSLSPYRYERQRPTNVVIRAPAQFIDSVLYPEYEALCEVFNTYLTDLTDRLISQEIWGDLTEAEKIIPLFK